jgi:hypothetical protein
VFYPNYTFGAAAEENRVTVTVRRTSGKLTRRRMPAWVARRAEANSRLSSRDEGIHAPRAHDARQDGMRLDNEMTATVRLWKQYDMECVSFTATTTGGNPKLTLGSEHRNLQQTSASVLRAFGRDKLTSPARLIWEKLWTFRLHPVGTQVPCANLEWHLATAADLVCQDDDGAPVVIEVKLGFDNAFANSGHTMEAPFEHYDDSPVNQWRLQVGFTAHMYARTHGLTRIPRALIFWVQRYQGYRLNVIEVLPFNARELEGIESVFVGRSDQKKKKRKQCPQ